MKKQKLVDLIRTINPHQPVDGLRDLTRTELVNAAKHEVLHLHEQLRRATDKIKPFPAPRTWSEDAAEFVAWDATTGQTKSGVMRDAAEDAFNRLIDARVEAFMRNDK